MGGNNVGLVRACARVCVGCAEGWRVGGKRIGTGSGGECGCQCDEGDGEGVSEVCVCECV